MEGIARKSSFNATLLEASRIPKSRVGPSKAVICGRWMPSFSPEAMGTDTGMYRNLNEVRHAREAKDRALFSCPAYTHG